MPKQFGFFERGRIDILNLAGVGFLTLSLVAVVSVTSNPQIKQIFAPKAVNTEYELPPVVPPPSIPPISEPITSGFTLDQVINTANHTPGTAGYDCSQGGCGGGSGVVSGYYESNGRYYPIGGTGNDPNRYASTSLAAVKANGGIVPASQPTQTQTQTTTGGFTKDQVINTKAAANTAGYLMSNGNVAGYYESNGRYYPIGGTNNNPTVYQNTSLATIKAEAAAAAAKANSIAVAEKRASDALARIDAAEKAAAELKAKQSVITVNQQGGVSIKVPNGGTAKYSSDCESGNSVGGVCQAAKITTSLPANYKDILNSVSPNTAASTGTTPYGTLAKDTSSYYGTGVTNYNYNGGSPSLFVAPIQPQQMTEQERLVQTYNDINTISGGFLGNYVGAYKNAAAANPINPKDNFLGQASTYLQQSFSREGLVASTKLGTVITAEVAAIAALPGIIVAGTTAAAGGSVLTAAGAAGAQAFTIFGGISTMSQTTDAFAAHVENPGSTEAWNKTGLAAMSWLNLKTADLLIKGISSVTIPLTQINIGTKALNTGVSFGNLVVDAKNAYTTCNQEGASTLDCGGAITAGVLDIGFGFLDLKQGQLSFGNPLSKVTDINPLITPTSKEDFALLARLENESVKVPEIPTSQVDIPPTSVIPEQDLEKILNAPIPKLPEAPITPVVETNPNLLTKTTPVSDLPTTSNAQAPDVPVTKVPEAPAVPVTPVTEVVTPAIKIVQPTTDTQTSTVTKVKDFFVDNWNKIASRPENNTITPPSVDTTKPIAAKSQPSTTIKVNAPTSETVTSGTKIANPTEQNFSGNVSDRWKSDKSQENVMTGLWDKVDKLKDKKFDPSKITVLDRQNIEGRDFLEIELPTGDKILVYKSTGTGSPELKQEGDWQIVNGFIETDPGNPDSLWAVKNPLSTQLTKGLNPYLTQLDSYLKQSGPEGLINTAKTKTSTNLVENFTGWWDKNIVEPVGNRIFGNAPVLENLDVPKSAPIPDPISETVVKIDTSTSISEANNIGEKVEIPPIKPGEIFDVKKELANIDLGDAAARTTFKEKLAYQQQGMVDMQTQLTNTITNNPDISLKDLSAQAEVLSSKYGLASWEKKNLDKMLKTYSSRRADIKSVLDKYHTDADLFEAIFGKKPQGKITIENLPTSINIIIEDPKDWAQMGSKLRKQYTPEDLQDVGGFYFPPGYDNIPLQKIRGKLSVQNGTENFKIKFPESSVGDISVHEGQHSTFKIIAEALNLKTYADDSGLLNTLLKAQKTGKSPNQITEAAINYAEAVKAELDYQIANESLAFLKQGYATDNVYEALINNYPLYTTGQERVMENITNLSLENKQVLQDSINKIFDDSQINTNLNAFSTLISKGYDTDGAIAILEKVPMSDWAKTASRTQLYQPVNFQQQPVTGTNKPSVTSLPERFTGWWDKNIVEPVGNRIFGKGPILENLDAPKPVTPLQQAQDWLKANIKDDQGWLPKSRAEKPTSEVINSIPTAIVKPYVLPTSLDPTIQELKTDKNISTLIDVYENTEAKDLVKKQLSEKLPKNIDQTDPAVQLELEKTTRNIIEAHKVGGKVQSVEQQITNGDYVNFNDLVSDVKPPITLSQITPNIPSRAEIETPIKPTIVSFTPTEVNRINENSLAIAQNLSLPSTGKIDDVAQIIGAINKSFANPASALGEEQRNLINILYSIEDYPNGNFPDILNNFIKDGGNASQIPQLFSDLLSENLGRYKSVQTFWGPVLDTYNEKLIPEINSLFPGSKPIKPIDPESIYWISNSESMRVDGTGTCNNGFCGIKSPIKDTDRNYVGINIDVNKNENMFKKSDLPIPTSISGDAISASKNVGLHVTLHESIHANTLHTYGIDQAVPNDMIVNRILESLTERTTILIEDQLINKFPEVYGNASRVAVYQRERNIDSGLSDALGISNDRVISFGLNQNPVGYLNYMDQTLNGLDDSGYKNFIETLYQNIRIGPKQRDYLLKNKLPSSIDYYKAIEYWTDNASTIWGVQITSLQDAINIKNKNPWLVFPESSLKSTDSLSKYLETSGRIINEKDYIPTSNFSQTPEGQYILKYERPQPQGTPNIKTGTVQQSTPLQNWINSNIKDNQGWLPKLRTETSTPALNNVKPTLIQQIQDTATNVKNRIVGEPAIKPGEIFDPQAELQDINLGNAAARADFKAKSAYQQKGIVDTQVELENTIRKNPDISLDELQKQIDAASNKYGFSPYQKSTFRGVNLEYHQRHVVIEKIFAKYPDDNSLYKAMFGKEPIGKVVITQGPISINIRVNNIEDYKDAAKYIKSDHPVSFPGGLAASSDDWWPRSVTLEGLNWDSDWITKLTRPDLLFQENQLLNHEEQHIINNLFDGIVTPKYPIDSVDTYEAWDGLINSIRTHNEEQISISLKKFVDLAKKQAEPKIVNELSAYLKEDVPTDLIYKILTNPDRSYNFYGRQKIGLSSQIEELLHGLTDADRQIISNVLDQEYNNLEIKNGLDAFNGLLSKGYTRNEALAYLQKEQLTDWPKIESRIPKQNLITRIANQASQRVVTPALINVIKSPLPYIGGVVVAYTTYNPSWMSDTVNTLTTWWQTLPINQNTSTSTSETSETISQPVVNQSAENNSTSPITQPVQQTSLAVPEQPAQQQALPKTNIVLLGDSITQGYLSDSLYEQLKAAGYDIEFLGNQKSITGGTTTEGHGGYSTAAIVNSLKANQWLYETGKPSVKFDKNMNLVVLQLGVNDLVNKNSINNTTIPNMRYIVDYLRKINPNVKIVITSVPKFYFKDKEYTEDVAKMNAKFSELASQMSTSDSLVIMGESFADNYNPSTNTSDGIHPYGIGADKIAESIVNTIENNQLITKQEETSFNTPKEDSTPIAAQTYYSQTSPEWQDYKITVNNKDAQGNITQTTKTMKQVGCGPTTVANILNEGGKKVTPTQIAKQIPSAYWASGGTSFQTNIEILKQNGYQADPYTKSLYNLTKYMKSDELLWISAKIEGIEHHTYIDGYTMENGKPVFSMRDPYFGADMKCSVASGGTFGCNGSSGQHTYNVENEAVIILTPPAI